MNQEERLDSLHNKRKELERDKECAYQKYDVAREMIEKEEAILVNEWSPKTKAESLVKVMDIYATYKQLKRERSELETKAKIAEKSYYHLRRKIDVDTALDVNAARLWEAGY